MDFVHRNCFGGDWSDCTYWSRSSALLETMHYNTRQTRIRKIREGQANGQMEHRE